MRTLAAEDRRVVGALRRTAPGCLRPALVRLADTSVAGAPTIRAPGIGPHAG